MTYKKFVLLVTLLCLMGAGVWAAETTGVGGACTNGQNAADWDTFFQCVGSVWKRSSLWLGASSDTCDSSHAGILQWTGSAFQGCDGSNWKTF